MILQFFLFTFIGYALKLAARKLTQSQIAKLDITFLVLLCLAFLLFAGTICVTTFSSEAVDGLLLTILQTIRFLSSVLVDITVGWFLFGLALDIIQGRVVENPEWVRQFDEIKAKRADLSFLDILKNKLSGLIDKKALNSVLDVMLNQAKRDVKDSIHEHKEHLARIALMEQQLQNLKSTRG